MSYHPLPWLVAETDLQVNVRVRDGKKFQHDGIRIELIGSIGTRFA